MYLFDSLKQELEKYLEPEQIDNIRRAYIHSRDAHGSQQRSSGDPYITHPVAVARILASMHLDPECIMAALLHDTLEDTALDRDTLAREFGETVADLVDGVSKLTQIQFETKEQAQAENLRKMIMAMVKDIRVILIKLADRLHNMQTLGPLRPDKRRRIARETLSIYAPIALRLGINTIRIELEDLSFAALYPMRSRILKASVLKARGNRREIISQINSAIDDCLLREQLEGEVLGREKHLYSLYCKMRDKGLSFNEVMDVYGFRIMVDKVDTCYRVLGAVHNLFKPIPRRFKDYIALPKVNGYQSLHTSLMGPYGVPIEVQIRTHEMEQMAVAGVAAHWLYKTQLEVGSNVQIRAQQWMRGLLELQKSAGNSQEFIEHVKVDLAPDAIYLFSPDGQIFVLPVGATPVDFAYAVHTDVGNSCVGVRINKKIASLNTVLVSGQTIEIVTARGTRPNSAWLSFVVTAKARASIRHFLKNQHRDESIALGRRLLDKALGAHPLKELDLSIVDEVVKESRQQSLDCMLAEIGTGSVGAFTLAQRLLAKSGLDKGPGQAMHLSSGPLAIEGTEGMVVSYGKCCRPIPGDPVVGAFSAGKGMVIHTNFCKNLNWQQPENYSPVRWAEGVSGEFVAELRVDVVNERGVLARLSTVLADCGSNIINVNIDERDGRVNTILFVITVHHRVHLAQVMKRLRVFRIVLRVARHKR